MNANGYPTRDEVTAILAKVKAASGKGLTGLSLVALLGLPGGCAQSSTKDDLHSDQAASTTGIEEHEIDAKMGVYDSSEGD